MFRPGLDEGERSHRVAYRRKSGHARSADFGSRSRARPSPSSAAVTSPQVPWTSASARSVRTVWARCSASRRSRAVQGRSPPFSRLAASKCASKSSACPVLRCRSCAGLDRASQSPCSTAPLQATAPPDRPLPPAHDRLCACAAFHSACVLGELQLDSLRRRRIPGAGACCDAASRPARSPAAEERASASRFPLLPGLQPARRQRSIAASGCWRASTDALQVACAWSRLGAAARTGRSGDHDSEMHPKATRAWYLTQSPNPFLILSKLRGGAR